MPQHFFVSVASVRRTQETRLFPKPWVFQLSGGASGEKPDRASLIYLRIPSAMSRNSPGARSSSRKVPPLHDAALVHDDDLVAVFAGVDRAVRDGREPWCRIPPSFSRSRPGCAFRRCCPARRWPRPSIRMRGFFEEDAGQRDALALTAGEVGSTLGQHKLIAALQLLDVGGDAGPCAPQRRPESAESERSRTSVSGAAGRRCFSRFSGGFRAFA